MDTNQNAKVVYDASNPLNQRAPSDKVDRASFPHQPSSLGRNLPATLENFEHLMDASGISIQFDVVKKRPKISVPGLALNRQNRDAVILTHLESLLVRNDMQPQLAQKYVLALADKSPIDPFADWVSNKPWDQTSRLNDVCETLVPAEGYKTDLRDALVRKWLLSIVAATFSKKGFRARGVLTLQGAQGLGKTTWFAKLITPVRLREEMIKLGHSWDGGSKDARLAALRHRIVELGELEGSFRREMAGLKAFITETDDKIRPPYARLEAEYPRSTIFAATVNDPRFLHDTTGNSRFWTVACERIDYDHDIDMQQVFAELKGAFTKGEQWWLTQGEEAALASLNRHHQVQTAIGAAIEESLDLDRKNQLGLPRLTANELLQRLGYNKPTNTQSKEANVALRALLGDPKRVRGHNRWSVPFRDTTPVTSDDSEDDDLY